MNVNVNSHRVVDLTPGRQVMINMLNLAGERHTMMGLLEVDVTVPRQIIAEYKDCNGETLSLAHLRMGTQ